MPDTTIEMLIFDFRLREQHDGRTGMEDQSVSSKALAAGKRRYEIRAAIALPLSSYQP